MPSKGPTATTEFYSPKRKGQQPKGTFARDQSTKVAFSIDRTFSASSSDYRQTSSSAGLFEEDDDDDFEETVKLNHHYQNKSQQHQNPSQNNNSSASASSSKPYNKSQQNPEHHHEVVYDFEDEEISVGLPSDLPSGMVDIEGNIIGNADIRFGQDGDDDDMSSIDNDENNPENNKNVTHDNNEYSSHHSPTSHDDTKQIPNDDYPNGIPNSANDTATVSSDGGGIQRKKSILSSRSRYNRSGGGCSVNSFNGSASGSSIISDGKMGSMNGSFNSQFYNNFYSRAQRRNDFQRYTRGPYAPLDRCNSTSASSANSSTITQHYYPEGGWGYVILATALFSHALLCGLLLCGGIFSIKTLNQFGHELRMETVWLTSLALGLGLFLSPIWVSICKRKSTRLTAVFGGLVSSLGCLFTSFASQFHQLFFSYAIFLGVGVGLTRDASLLMVGQYFKRKREFVEILLVSGPGLGILVMSIFMECAISSVGWRLGLQAVTGSLVLTFFLGSCYRSASLYHPQRRAILHLKNQKRKIKEKEKTNDKPPFLDFSCLSSRSFQMFLVSTAFTTWGLYGPLFHLAFEYYDEVLEQTDQKLTYVYIGAGWVIGCWIFGFLAIQRNEDCQISKLYLCQVSSLVIGISIIAIGNVKDHSNGMVSFSWAYGIGLGGYNYILKVYTYEKIRARLFPRAWSFIQCVQGASLFLGIPTIGYVNTNFGWRTGYYVSGGSVLLGFLIMFLSAVGKTRLTRNKSMSSSMKTCETTDSMMQSPGMRRISFTFPDEQMSPRMSKESRSSCSDRSMNGNSCNEQPMMPKELTRISEEGILDTNH